MKQQEFNPERFLGTWYETFRDARSPFQSGCCGTAVYKMGADKNSISITNSEQRFIKSGSKLGQLSKKRSAATAVGRISDPTKSPLEGRLDLKFSELQPFWGNYDLLETDYDNYAVIYSCTNLLGGLYRTEYAFVLSREPIRVGTPQYDKILGVTQRVFSYTHIRDHKTVLVLVSRFLLEKQN